MNKEIIDKVKSLINAYGTGKLGDTTMPENTHPDFKGDLEAKRLYYTLPMALNYQRDSFKLWEAAKNTYNDESVNSVYNLKFCSLAEPNELRKKLTKHKLALQPNKHIDTWRKIAMTIYQNWESLDGFFSETGNSYLNAKELVQKSHKKGFPYLSGPKIFNYWMYIMTEYGEVGLTDRENIEIAPDTHVIKASVRLGILSTDQAETLNKNEISQIWRNILLESEIAPIDVHSPLWFWSRSGFEFLPTD